MNQAEDTLKRISTQISQGAYSYQTKSLDEFAVMLAKGAVVVGRKKEAEDDRFFTFMLRADFDMEPIALQLASRTLEMNAYDLLEANRRAKSVVHNR